MKREIIENAVFELGREIQKAREEKNLSRVGLSVMLSIDYGVSVGEDTIKKYELGSRQIPAGKLLLIAHILDMDLNSLYRSIKFECYRLN